MSSKKRSTFFYLIIFIINDIYYNNEKRIIITEEEKKHILSLHQNLNIKDILQEGLKGDVYTTENDQRIYFGTNTYNQYIDIPLKTKFNRVPGGATAWGGKLVFRCSRVGTVEFENGTGNKHFTYNRKTYWANALQKKLISVFCSSSSSSNVGCLKGNCQNGYGEQSFGNGTIYKGQYKNGKFEGKGVLTVTGDGQEIFSVFYDGGLTYSGTWVNGTLNGTGKIVSNDGIFTYYGGFKNSKYNGKGKYDGYNDGSYWWGEFSMDNTTDQTYYKNKKGCYFKGKGGEYLELSSKSSGHMDKMECTPGQWIDLEKVKSQTPVGSNPNNSEVGNNSSNEVRDPSGNIISGCTQYNDCSSKDGSTTNFVKCDTCSEISRLQACLKDANGNMLKTDGYWGKKTEAALNALNYNGTDGITSETITTICTNFNQPQV